MANPELLLLSERDAHGGGNNFRRSNTTAHGRRAATLPRTEMHHNVTEHQLHAACFPQPEVAHQHVRHTGATASDWPMAGLVFATPTKDQASQRQPCERKGQATNCGLHSTVSRSHPSWTEDTTRLALPCTLQSFARHQTLGQDSGLPPRLRDLCSVARAMQTKWDKCVGCREQGANPAGHTPHSCPSSCAPQAEHCANL